MMVLVTAGNTQVPLDRVRCLTNIFTGRTGTQIALEGYRRGHAVTLLTSHPEVVTALHSGPPLDAGFAVFPYRTFDELNELLADRVPGNTFDAIIHCAAVSDYLAGGIYAPDRGTRFEIASGRWHADGSDAPTLLDRAAGKVKSEEPELWVRLVRAPKLVDRIRSDWGFRGVLVKFKLEVGISDEELLHIAERSRTHSGADLMVANTLEGAGQWASLGPVKGAYERVTRLELAGRLLDLIEQQRQSDG